MKPKARFSCCLLCSSKCHSKETESLEEEGPGIEVVGAEKCVALEKQLERMFVLLKILDVPASWCERMLGKESEEDNRSAGPESWFNVCGGCLEGRVRSAWQIHQQILALQGKMAVLKAEILEVMRRSFVEEFGRERRDWGRFREESCDYQIRKLLFPELMVKSEVVEEEDLGDEEWECDAIEGSTSLEEEEVPLKLEEMETTEQPPKKRGPGRPRKSLRKPGEIVFPKNRRPGRPSKPTLLKKPGFRHPLYYIQPHWGTLRRKKFHWKVCRICDARYKSDEEYEAHQRAHDEVKQKGGQCEFSCAQCQFPARDANELEAHIHSRHVNRKHREKKYQCTKCPFVTVVWKVLREHVNQEHSDLPEEELGSEINLICEICDKRMKTLQALVRHKNAAHPQLEGPEGDGGLQCPHCDRKFPSKRLLQCHVGSSHKRGDRFVCEECGVGYQHQSALEYHKLNHVDRSKQGELVCHLCGLDFHDKRGLNSHYRKCHNSDKPESEQIFKCRFCDVTSPFKVVIKRHLESHKQELGHKCRECGKLYTNAQGLSRHIKLIHNSSGKWPCPYCRKEYSCEDYMKDHIKRFCRMKELLKTGGETSVVEGATHSVPDSSKIEIMQDG